MNKKIKLMILIILSLSLVMTAGCELVANLLETDILVFLNLKDPELGFNDDDEIVDLDVAPDYLTVEGILVYDEDEIVETDIVVEFNGEVLQYDEAYNQGISGDIKVLTFRNRSLVPLRELSGKLGFDIYWEGAGQKQELFIKGKIKDEQGEEIPLLITTKLNSNEFEISLNGKKERVFTETPTIKYEGKIYVPLRFIGETLGLEVNWLQEEKKVDFITK